MSPRIAGRAIARRTAFAFVALTLLLCAAGCSSDDESSSSAAATTAPAQATKQDESTSTSGVLVRVGQTDITRARYDAVNLRLERNYGADRGYPGKRYFAPPRYRLCVKDRRLRRSVPPDATVEAVRKECRHIFWGGRRQLLGNLIEAEWLAREAAKQHVKTPSGFIARLQTLPQTLSENAVETADGSVGDQAVAAYYRKHRGDFLQAEQRRFREILSATRSKARRAKAALRAGEGWATVVRRYGVPGLTPPEPITASQANLGVALGDAVFDARPGEIAGPAAVESAFAVVKVESTTPAHQLSLAQARDSIETALGDYKRQRAAVADWRTLRADARRDTICVTELKVPYCGNGPEEGFDADGAMSEPVFQPPVVPAPTG